MSRMRPRGTFPAPPPRRPQSPPTHSSLPSQSGSSADEPRRVFTVERVITLIAALAAVASALYAYGQERVTKQQDVIAEQQQLLTLVSAIIQEPSQLLQAEQSLKGSALVDVDVQYESELVANCEAAVNLVNTLNGQGVTGIEYVQIAEGLRGTDNLTALAYLAHGAKIALDPNTRVDALRAAANILYQLGGAQNDKLAHQDMLTALSAFDGKEDFTTDAENSNIVTYLIDADKQIKLKQCSTAAQEIRNANSLIRSLGSAAGIPGIVRNNQLLQQDQLELNQRCMS